MPKSRVRGVVGVRVFCGVRLSWGLPRRTDQTTRKISVVCEYSFLRKEKCNGCNETQNLGYRVKSDWDWIGRI
jgi:hypothetical protein